MFYHNFIVRRILKNTLWLWILIENYLRLVNTLPFHREKLLGWCFWVSMSTPVHAVCWHSRILFSRFSAILKVLDLEIHKNDVRFLGYLYKDLCSYVEQVAELTYNHPYSLPAAHWYRRVRVQARRTAGAGRRGTWPSAPGRRAAAVRTRPPAPPRRRRRRRLAGTRRVPRTRSLHLLGPAIK